MARHAVGSVARAPVAAFSWWCLCFGLAPVAVGLNVQPSPQFQLFKGRKGLPAKKSWLSALGFKDDCNKSRRARTRLAAAASVATESKQSQPVEVVQPGPIPAGPPEVQSISGSKLQSGTTMFGAVPVHGIERIKERQGHNSRSSWTVMMPAIESSTELLAFCETLTPPSRCHHVGEPEKGGIPFITVHAFEREMRSMLVSAQSTTINRAFVTLDRTISIHEPVTRLQTVPTKSWALERIQSNEPNSYGDPLHTSGHFVDGHYGEGVNIYILDSGIAYDTPASNGGCEFDGRAKPGIDVSYEPPLGVPILGFLKPFMPQRRSPRFPMGPKLPLASVPSSQPSVMEPDLRGPVALGAGAPHVASAASTASTRSQADGCGEAKGAENGYDNLGHGTMCAALAGGKTWGVARAANLYSVKALDRFTGLVSNFIKGMDWAITHNVPGMKIVSGSFAGEISGDKDWDMALERLEKNNIMFVTAAGNLRQPAMQFEPVRIATAFAVGALDIQDHIGTYSNYGEGINIWAPGSSVPSAIAASVHNTNLIGRGALMDGTSFACPLVTGTIAAYAQACPDRTPAQMRAIILAHSSTTRDQQLPVVCLGDQCAKASDPCAED